jgi:thiol-disulfide isomerase/thioredoxin
MSGAPAFDFRAERMDGSIARLSDSRGKVIFIDNWATWCAPCLQNRVKVLELAEKYENDPRVEIWMISLNSNKESWLSFLETNDRAHPVQEMIIVNGMRTPYGDRYNIKSIPKYVLISPQGTIIDANLPEPSAVVAEMIEREIDKL